MTNCVADDAWWEKGDYNEKNLAGAMIDIITNEMNVRFYSRSGGWGAVTSCHVRLPRLNYNRSILSRLFLLF